MAGRRGLPKLFETKYFGLVLGLLVFALLVGITYGTTLIRNVEQKTLDFNFRMKNTLTRSRIQEGWLLSSRTPISPPTS
jgi:hypothetical protein